MTNIEAIAMIARTMTTRACLIALALITFSASTRGAMVTVSQTDNALIPDNNLNGIAETISLGSSIQSITDVQLTLNVGETANGDQPFNGDYYAYLTHGSSLVVLLNRVGVTLANPYGYSDTGLAVTFDDSGADIHNYQSGSYTLNSSGQLTGIGRPTDEPRVR